MNQNLPYQDLWKELHIKFLTQPKPQPKPQQKPQPKPQQKPQTPRTQEQKRSQTPKKQNEQKSCPLKNKPKTQEIKSEMKAADYPITLFTRK